MMRPLARSFAVLSVCAGVLVLSWSAAAHAQQPEQAKPAFDLLTRVPEAPAAAALDIARTENTPPSIMRRLSLEVLNTEEATGFAAETSPYLVYLSLKHGYKKPEGYLSIDRYQRDPVTRALARFSMSAAAVRSGEEKGDRAAFALRWTAFNLGDPYNDKDLYTPGKTDPATGQTTAPTGCVVRAITGGGPPPTPDSDGNISDAERAAYKEKVGPPLTQCITDYDKKHWNATALQFSAVQLWNAPNGGMSELDPAGQRYTGVLSYGFEGWEGLRENSQLLVNAGHGENVRFVDEAGTASRRDETRAGLRLRVAPNGEVSGRDFNVSAEAQWSENDYTGATPTQEEWTYRIGAEWRLSGNAWLSVTAEDRSGDDVAGDDKRVGLQLRWALGEESQFGGAAR